MSKKKKVTLIILAVLILIGIGVVLYLYRGQLTGNVTKKKETKAVEKIKGYDYTLEKRDTKLFKDNFYKLKEVLSEKDVDYKKYAEYLSKLYIIDLYTITNKNSKYDVGGSEYVLESARENYELKVRDTMYKYVEDKSNNRTQNLPEVSSIKLKNIKESEFELGKSDESKESKSGEKFDSYEVELTFDYKEDLGYDTKATVILIKQDNKLYVVEQK